MKWRRREEPEDEGNPGPLPRHVWTMCVDCRSALILVTEGSEETDDEIIQRITDGDFLPRCNVCAPRAMISEAEQFLADVWGEGNNA